MRRQLSDTAARMFLARGFDTVRVAEVAEACGVSEKTVFNYFPTKEALLLDRLETTIEALRGELARTDITPLQAALDILAAELAATTAAFEVSDPAAAIASYQRFGDMIRATPSLHAYRSATLDRFVTVAAEALAQRAEADPDDPDIQITAAALVGLWRVQFGSLRRHLSSASIPDAVHHAVTADVDRAARILAYGLSADPPGAARPPTAAHSCASRRSACGS
jgi:AcrR family transcriptional regulator